MPCVPPSGYSLYPNTPNPFGANTVILYDLPRSAGVKMRVYDVGGRAVRVLADLPAQEPGSHEIHWDGRDPDRDRAVPGMYFCFMESGDFASTQKMIVSK